MGRIIESATVDLDDKYTRPRGQGSSSATRRRVGRRVGPRMDQTCFPPACGAGRDARGVAVHHRRELDAVQRAFRETVIVIVIVIVHDQTCAAEKRRRRKRGKFPELSRRAFIDPAGYEGCGDCGVKSNSEAAASFGFLSHWTRSPVPIQ